MYNMSGKAFFSESASSFAMGKEKPLPTILMLPALYEFQGEVFLNRKGGVMLFGIRGGRVIHLGDCITK